MNFEIFQKSLSGSQPPSSITPYLQALWYDGKNDWEKAHTVVQDMQDKTSAWIHAYLHRKEGDTGNADYWYNRAGRKRPAASLQEEWKDIVKELL
ncbi:MAG: hypothetical protein ABIR18_03050 [Chitinophagaceae bacterium]